MGCAPLVYRLHDAGLGEKDLPLQDYPTGKIQECSDGQSVPVKK